MIFTFWLSCLYLPKPWGYRHLLPHLVCLFYFVVVVFYHRELFWLVWIYKIGSLHLSLYFLTSMQFVTPFSIDNFCVLTCTALLFYIQSLIHLLEMGHMPQDMCGTRRDSSRVSSPATVGVPGATLRLRTWLQAHLLLSHLASLSLQCLGVK